MNGIIPEKKVRLETKFKIRFFHVCFLHLTWEESRQACVHKSKNNIEDNKNRPRIIFQPFHTLHLIYAYDEPVRVCAKIFTAALFYAIDIFLFQ